MQSRNHKFTQTGTVPTAKRWSRRTLRRSVTGVLVAAVMATSALPAQAAPQPKLSTQGSIDAPARTQISFEHIPTGTHFGTANETEARPGLSIVKLYIADYVFQHGSATDWSRATQMIRVSDDALARELYSRYPSSINATAATYGLTNTRGAAHWGYSTTSTRDTVRFLAAKQRRNPLDPVLLAMASAAPVAADGYRQDYGTATLPEVTGSKWGWSDDRRSIHASASIGSNFAIAAHTFGTKETHTQDVQAAFGPQPLPQRLQPQPPQLESPALPGMPGWPGVPGWPAVPGLLEAPALPAIPGLRSPGFS